MMIIKVYWAYHNIAGVEEIFVTFRGQNQEQRNELANRNNKQAHNYEEPVPVACNR